MNCNNIFGNFIYRCKDCFNIPLLKVIYEKEGTFLKVKCENYNHNSLNNLYSLKEISIIKCNNCLKEYDIFNMFYCFEINKVFCNECKLHNKSNSYINLINLDSLCLIHSKQFKYYCQKCMKNLCKDCIKSHEHSNYIKTQNYFSIKFKDIINKEINCLENNINQLEEFKYKFINYLNEYIELNKVELLFYKNIFSTYLYEEKMKNLNCHIIQNLKELKIKFSNKCNEKILKQGNNLLTLIKSIKLGNNNLTHIKTINSQNSGIYHLSILQNGDLVSSSSDGDLTIYDQKTFNIKLTLNEHYTALYYFTQLKNGNIITCSGDKTMKIIELNTYNNNKDNNNNNNIYYKVIQILNCDSPVYKVIEYKNNLVSVCNKGIMQEWRKNNLKYYNVTNIIIQKINSSCNILKISNNEIVTSSREDKVLKFWDFQYKNIFTINNIETQWASGCICMLNSEILCVATSYSKGFYLIEISSHQIINKINGPRFVYSIIKCFDDYFLTAVIGKDYDNSINKYKYEKGKLILINENLNVHDGSIHTLAQLENGLIASGSNDRCLKIWE